MNTTEQLSSALAGRYTIEKLIGEGGMATVYLARDVRHNRRVALKVLKPDLGAIVGVERFLSEIEVTANLQHPNLLPLFDSGVADGLLFYVMPYVEGESLRARIEREKQLPVDEAVRIAVAVAGALDYAHRRGVIHRDLKPENILLHDGQPLVADFGIALAVSNAGGSRITQTGLSLGTPQYMSPEQATGDRVIDQRSDLYSLAAVVYEMLAGEPPHTGTSSQAIIARLLTERPRSLRTTRPSVPAYVEAAVEHALEKLAADRFASVKDFADALTGKVMMTSPALTATSSAPPASMGQASRERLLVGALTVAVLAAFALGTMLVRARRAPPEAAEVRFQIQTPPAGSLRVSVSPDGKVIEYPVRDSTGLAVSWARPLRSASATALMATTGLSNGFWSPDSRYLAFSSENRLRKVALSGGAAETICDYTGAFRGGSWNQDNVIVFAAGSVLFRVSAAGGTPTPISLSTPGTVPVWSHPWFLPDGEHFVVLSLVGNEGARGAYIASINGGTPVRVMASDSRVSFAPPNQLLFVRDETLYAQTLDMRRFQVIGEPVRVLDDVGANSTNGNAGYWVSTNGVLVSRPTSGLAAENARVRWYSRAGVAQEALGDLSDINEIDLAPDEKRVAMTRRVAGSVVNQLAVLDLSSRITSQVTNRPEGVSGVLWTPDSRFVTFAQSGLDSIFSRRIGSAVDSLVYRGSYQTRAEDYSSDGKTLLLRQPSQGKLLAYDATSTDGGRELVTLGRFDEVRLSPDGRFVSWNAFIENTWQVWVASYPSFDNRQQVSPNGGVQARWRADSKELFFLAPDGKVMSALLVPGTAPAFRAPTVLFQSPNTSPAAVTDQYDVTRDGQRFLFIVRERQAGNAGVPPITVIVNWMNALPKK